MKKKGPNEIPGANFYSYNYLGGVLIDLKTITHCSNRILNY